MELMQAFSIIFTDIESASAHWVPAKASKKIVRSFAFSIPDFVRFELFSL